MRVFRLCKANQSAYNGKGAELYGGRWNSKGTRVLYMSESRALAVLEILVHLTIEIPDKYLLGGAEIPVDLEIETVPENELPAGWQTPIPTQQTATKQIGDAWLRGGRSVALSVPSVIVEERNFVLNPAHPDFKRITFQVPAPFDFDGRFFDARASHRS